MSASFCMSSLFVVLACFLPLVFMQSTGIIKVTFNLGDGISFGEDLPIGYRLSSFQLKNPFTQDLDGWICYRNVCWGRTAKNLILRVVDTELQFAGVWENGKVVKNDAIKERKDLHLPFSPNAVRLNEQFYNMDTPSSSSSSSSSGATNTVNSGSGNTSPRASPLTSSNNGAAAASSSSSSSPSGSVSPTTSGSTGSSGINTQSDSSSAPSASASLGSDTASASSSSSTDTSGTEGAKSEDKEKEGDKDKEKGKEKGDKKKSTKQDSGAFVQRSWSLFTIAGALSLVILNTLI